MSLRSPYRRAAHHRRGPKKSARRCALELLASCPEGCTEAVLLANGLSVDLLVDLVRAGLATATPERIRMGPKTIEVARVRITDEGRRVLNEANP